MANYETLKTAIQQVVKTNGNNEITGALLQQSLLAMINSLGSGYQYKGIATPTTNPGTLDQKVFYFAFTPGTYSNFNGLVLSKNEIAILAYDTIWAKQITGFATKEQCDELEQLITYLGESQNLTISESIMNGYINATTGIVETWPNPNYSILKFQFLKDAKVRLQRNVASVLNGNVIAVMDNVTGIAAGVNLSQFIVDDGTTTPLDKEFTIRNGQYLVVGFHVTESQRTQISYREILPIKNIVQSLETITGQLKNTVDNGLFYLSDGTPITINSLILASAYIDGSGNVKSWSSASLNIYAYQAQTEMDIKVVRTGSVYYTNDILCKCRTLNGIAVGGQIDGDIVCIGTDYPFETVVHLNQNEYLVRSGSATKCIFTPQNKNSLKPYVRNLDGLKIDFEGDSIMVGGGANGGWPTLIATYEGVQATNNGSSGSRIANNSAGTSILQRILTRTADDFDMIIIQGGFNDGVTPMGTFDRNDYRESGENDYDPTTFYGALEIICRYCLGTFKRAGMIVGYNWGNNTWNTTLANAMVAVCEKWGMPYVDLRSKAGFNLHTESLRVKYGIYNGNVPVYDSTRGYALDEKAKYGGSVYKANQVIASPAGAFDSSKWTYIGLEYDQCHCNEDGYKKSVGAIIQLIKSIV